MITPKEKAAELIEKFHQASYYPDPNAKTVTYVGWFAKRFATIAVDEVIDSIKDKLIYNPPVHFWDVGTVSLNPTYIYYLEVKKEIDNYVGSR